MISEAGPRQVQNFCFSGASEVKGGGDRRKRDTIGYYVFLYWLNEAGVHDESSGDYQEDC